MDVHGFIMSFMDRFSGAVDLNDPAHRFGHFAGVFETGEIINTRLGLGYPSLAIAVVAYGHDLFAWSRENHHLLSGTWMESTEDPIIVKAIEEIAAMIGRTEDQARNMLADACREHRASFRGEFSSEFSELMNSADLEIPAGLGPMLVRAYQYGKAKGLGTTHEEWVDRAQEHMVEKFGRNGYALYPGMYMEVFKEELEVIYKEIDDLTYDVAEEIISSLI